MVGNTKKCRFNFLSSIFIIGQLLLIQNASCADLNEATSFFDIHYYGYTEPGVMDEYSRLPSVTIGYQDFEAIRDADGLGSLSGTVELSAGYIRYDGTGLLDHWYSKFLAEVYTPVGRNFYLGLGYRRLFDDLGPGASTTGALGYDRLSQYFYLPLGYVINFNDGGSFKYQYNLFIEGSQTSYLTQAGYLNDPENTQSSGYGLDVSYLPASGNWEGYVRYWYIDTSDLVACNTSQTTGLCYEPQKETIEIGFRVPF